MGAIQKIPAGEFKSKCLKLMQDVADSHDSLIVTKHGKPLVKLVPLVCEEPASYYGIMKGTVEIKEDITKPTGEDWKAYDDKNRYLE